MTFTAATGLMFQILKSAGTASRDFDIDYVTFYQHNTTGRRNLNGTDKFLCCKHDLCEGSA